VAYGDWTEQVNAHTSAVDALWAGVPIVSLARESMAARQGLPAETTNYGYHGCNQKYNERE
jgi:hypothetical protein